MPLNSFHCELHHSSSASFITSLKIFLFCCLPVKFDHIRASKMMSKLWLVKTSHLFSLKNAFNNSFYRWYQWVNLLASQLWSKNWFDRIKLAKLQIVYLFLSYLPKNGYKINVLISQEKIIDRGFFENGTKVKNTSEI